MRVRFNWGTGITLTYTAFALATSTFVAFAMNRRVDLVSPDYYAQSLQLDRRMAAERNALALGARLSVVEVSARRLRLSLPRELAPHATGTIRLYRASSAAEDRDIALAVSADGYQDIPLDGLARGRWTVQVQWTALGRGYFVQRDVTAH
jgi:nitrogen fixation protein FixH